MAVSGDQFATTVVDHSERAEAVILQFEDPFWMVERHRSARQRHRLECHV
jgi:hypothetical protein